MIEILNYKYGIQQDKIDLGLLPAVIIGEHMEF